MPSFEADKFGLVKAARVVLLFRVVPHGSISQVWRWELGVGIGRESWPLDPRAEDLALWASLREFSGYNRLFGY